jgi:hypothetical protein
MRAVLVFGIVLAQGFINPAYSSTESVLHLPTFQIVHAYVTGYNTVPEQNGDPPCASAAGVDICGRTDVVACPRRISLGTFLVIRGTIYVCEDRLANEYDGRFDIDCDKDMNCPSQVTGWADIKIFAEDPRRLIGYGLLRSASPTPARR